MTSATLMAGAAGMLGVAAAWEAVAAIDRRGWLEAVERALVPLRRGGEVTGPERRRLTLVAAGVLCTAGWLLAGAPAAIALGAAGPWSVRWAMAWRGRRRSSELARSAPAVARGLSDALAGGHSVRGAIIAAAHGGGVTGAAGDDLRAAAAALDLGETTDAVLERLRRRAADPGWDTLVAAVLLQREAGGDLAGLLRGLATRMEEARRADADARSATAQARFTAWLVAALPGAAALLAELGSPGYLASLARAPLTAVLVGASLALQLAAVLAVRRIARVTG